MFRYRNLLLGGTLCLSCAAFVSAADAPAYVTAAVASPARPPQQMKRDADRKPADLMAFAGVKQGDKVAELVPQNGYDTYYTQVISKIVGPQGRVYAFVPLRGFPSIQALYADEKKQREAGKNPAPNSLQALLEIQHTTDYKNLMSIQGLLASADGDCMSPKLTSTSCFGLPEQVDAVFTGAGYHELHNNVYGPANNGPVDMVAINKAIFREMKPGGVYVVSDYAAAKGAGFTKSADLNRIEADAVKSELAAAGFTFDGESDVLMNAGDDLSEPASGDKSARFVLRFRKPANASPVTKRPPLGIMANYFENTYSASGTRSDMYHADGTYQEFGTNDMQRASIYFDADGNNCMYHESPADQEGFVMCHEWGPDKINAKPGDSWANPNGSKSSLTKGYVYPAPRPAGQQQQARPAAAQ